MRKNIHPTFVLTMNSDGQLGHKSWQEQLCVQVLNWSHKVILIIFLTPLNIWYFLMVTFNNEPHTHYLLRIWPGKHSDYNKRMSVMLCVSPLIGCENHSKLLGWPVTLAFSVDSPWTQNLPSCAVQYVRETLQSGWVKTEHPNLTDITRFNYSFGVIVFLMKYSVFCNEGCIDLNSYTLKEDRVVCSPLEIVEGHSS